MDQPNPLAEAVAFIKDHLERGVPADYIRQHFLYYGWPPHHIDQAMAEANGVQHPVTPNPTRRVQTSHKYRITRALIDAFSAIRRNPVQYFCFLLGGAVVYLIGFALLVGLLLHSLQFGSEIASGSSSKVLLIIEFTVYCVLFVVWASLTSTFILATTSKILAAHPAHARQSFTAILQDGLRATPRAALAYGVATVLTLFPYFLTILVLLISLLSSFGSSSLFTSIGVAGILFIFALLWMLIASLRFSLVQQVAIFEPELSIRQILHRSYYLLKSGGQWFILKGVFCILVVTILLSLLTHNSVERLTLDNHDWYVNVSYVAVTVITQAVLTMLYLNRVAVRGES
jgi:hypothetical protein